VEGVEYIDMDEGRMPLSVSCEGGKESPSSKKFGEFFSVTEEEKTSENCYVFGVGI
jgi:hypothetical protein